MLDDNLDRDTLGHNCYFRAGQVSPVYLQKRPLNEEIFPLRLDQ